MIIRLRKVKALMRKWDEFLNEEFVGMPYLQQGFFPNAPAGPPSL
jgi:hypothetical protein